MKKVLITGLTGFAGSHLAEHLVSNSDLHITGTYLTDESLANISSIRDKIEVKQIDLTKKDEVSQLVSSVKPDQLYHLAAFPSPKDSFADPSLYIHNNIDAQLHLLEAI